MEAAFSKIILIHYGEIGLKGKNQPNFRKKLKENIRRRLSSINLDWSVSETRGQLMVDVPLKDESTIDIALEKLKEVFGIAWFAVADRLAYDKANIKTNEQTVTDVEKRLLHHAEKLFSPGISFCVRVKRGNKDFPLTSSELERRLGAFIIQHSEWEKVDLEQPDVTFHVDITVNEFFIYGKKWKGPGGLPTGTSGHVLSLLSGGIDSPIASFLAARRGCQLDFIHFATTTMQQKEAEKYKISKIVAALSNYTLRSKLYLVPYGHFNMAMFRQDKEYELILFRRFMIRTAERLAQQTKAQALVTGDNLAQVASQTLPNIVSTSRSIQLPVLRPVLTYDKQEIVNLAKQIGTFEISIEPYKDCCAIMSQHPKTISDHNKLSEIEETIFGEDYEVLIDQTVADGLCLEFQCGELVGEG